MSQDVIDRLIQENSFLREKIRKAEFNIHSEISETEGLSFEGMILYLINQIKNNKIQKFKLEKELKEIKKEHSNLDSLCLRIDQILNKK